MLRVIVSVVVPLVLPTIFYFTYAWYVARRARMAGVEEPKEIDAPWSWLIGAGVVLAAISFGANFMGHGDAPGGVYVPPHMEDGKIVPGRVVPK